MLKLAFLVVVTLLLISLSVAQDQAASGPPGCGAPDTKFEVNTERGQRLAQPEAGKALLYFIQDDSEFLTRPRPTTRLGIDGKWVGATHSNSYLDVAVDPGVHHLCASWQPGVGGQSTAAVHFTAEAGTIYYFGVKNRPTDLTFGALDSDEGQFLASQFSLSVSKPKK